MTKSTKQRGIVLVRADANDPKALADLLEKRIADFRSANDERFAALEKGMTDVVSEEKVDKINASVTETQQKLEAALKEQSARADALEAAANRPAIGDNKARDFKAEAVEFLSGKSGVESTKVDDADVEAYTAYASGMFAKFLRKGDQAHEVQAAMQVGKDSDGGYWVPTEQSNDIKTRIFETSPMRQHASVMSITTDSISFPNDTNSAVSGGWVGETASRAETATPQIGEQKISVHEQYANPRVTQKLLDMSTINVESWLNGKIADIMERTENTAFVSGTGVDKPRGFLDYKNAAVTTADTSRAWGVLQYVPSGAAGGVPSLSGSSIGSDPDAFIDMIAALKPAYRGNAMWFMNRSSEAALRKLKDIDGNYLVDKVTGMATGFNLFGYPIVTMEDMPDIGSDSYSVAFGDMGISYQIVDGRGIRILRDPFTAKPYVQFYTTKWTGGDVVNFDALKLMKFATS